MIDPLISLSFALHSNKGAYALLLGSGVSKSAGIPTGWEIVLDLIRKLAVLKGEECEPDPAAWYKRTFGQAPDYSQLLDEITNSSEERLQLLRNYFEPTEQDREEGRKIPGLTHKAAAKLVASGHVRVILTTNFDRLIEQALNEEGISPTIINTPDASEGAMPLVHEKAVVIKLHGDYLDSRIKNTTEELAFYDDRVSKLLDRVFDEFGLIVCGWSAEWDTALRAALERCKTYRFGFYWTTRGKLGHAAQHLIRLRRGQIIQIKDANTFFQELTEKIQALEEFDRPHPLSAAVAKATLKRYLEEPRYRIRLHDLVMEEVNKIYNALSDENTNPPAPYSVGKEIRYRVKKFDALSEIIIALMSTGCYWGETIHDEIWIKCLERLGNPPKRNAGIVTWINFQSYPALLALYAGGIAALAARRHETFANLLIKSIVRNQSKEYSVLMVLHPHNVLDSTNSNQLSGYENHYTAFNDYMFDLLREPLREIFPSDEKYEEYFDRFEYLFALIHADTSAKEKNDDSHMWGPVGRFGWKLRKGYGIDFYNKIETEAKEAGNNWPLFQLGFFSRSLDRFLQVKQKYNKDVLTQLNWH